MAASVQGIFGVGIVISGFLVFFRPIPQDIGVDSMVIGLVCAISNPVVPAAGWMADQIGARGLVLFGRLLTGAALVLLSSSYTYRHLVVFYSGAASVGRVGSITLTLMTTVNQWFVRRKPLAMSILSTAFVDGAAAVVPFLALGSTHLGWRANLLYSGIFLMLLYLPVSLTLWNRPEERDRPPP